MDTSEIILHLGEDHIEPGSPVSPPIYQTSNFCFPSFEALREGLKDEFGTPFYTRGHNPTVKILRDKIAALEGTEDALVFSSGSAAISSAVFSVVKQGDHIICVNNPYSWTNHLITQILPDYGITYTLIDGRETAGFENAIKPNTKLIYLESPNSLTFELQDLEAVANVAKSKEISTICDNSYATPLGQSPHALGIDLVVHSSSKYLNGHGDVVSGVIAGSRKRIRKILEEQYMTFGGIIGPMEAWLIMRGLRTLELRLERSSQSAEKVVDFLVSSDKVKAIHYPFHSSHPQYELAKKQMRFSGGLFTLELHTNDMEKIAAFSNKLKYFLRACSWGGYESLHFPLAALCTSESYKGRDELIDKVRIYVGLEDPNLLIDDLKAALEEI